MTATLKSICCVTALAAAVIGTAQAQISTLSGGELVRGTLQGTDTKSLQVTTPNGVVTLAIAAPLTIYRAHPATLARVKQASFVGVTTVKQADGTELAKEIHIFPEAFRGLGEGSHMMDAAPGVTPSNRMTNGSVASTRPAYHPAPSRMTNGTVDQQAAGGATLAVDYGNGTQRIKVPANVTVTEIGPVTATLTPGARVSVLATKNASGAWVAQKVLLSTPPKS